MYTTYLDAPAIIYSPHSISQTQPTPTMGGGGPRTWNIHLHPQFKWSRRLWSLIWRRHCANLTLGQLRKAQVNGFSVDVHLGVQRLDEKEMNQSEHVFPSLCNCAKKHNIKVFQSMSLKLLDTSTGFLVATLICLRFQVANLLFYTWFLDQIGSTIRNEEGPVRNMQNHIDISTHFIALTRKSKLGMAPVTKKSIQHPATHKLHVCATHTNKNIFNPMSLGPFLSHITLERTTRYHPLEQCRAGGWPMIIYMVYHGLPWPGIPCLVHLWSHPHHTRFCEAEGSVPKAPNFAAITIIICQGWQLDRHWLGMFRVKYSLEDPNWSKLFDSRHASCFGFGTMIHTQALISLVCAKHFAGNLLRKKVGQDKPLDTFHTQNIYKIYPKPLLLDHGLDCSGQVFCHAGNGRKHHPICIHLLGINNRKRLKPHQIQNNGAKRYDRRTQIPAASLKPSFSAQRKYHSSPRTCHSMREGWDISTSPALGNECGSRLIKKKVPTQCISLHHQNQKYQVTSSVVIPQNPSGVDWAATGKYGPPWAVCFFFLLSAFIVCLR